MEILKFMLAVCLAQSTLVLGATEVAKKLSKDLENAAEHGEHNRMKALLRNGAQCYHATLAMFLCSILGQGKPISDEAVDMTELVLRNVTKGIVNMACQLRDGNRYLPLTWVMEKYAMEGNALKLADLLIDKGGADPNQEYSICVYAQPRGALVGMKKQYPLHSAQKSQFKGWVAYLLKKGACPKSCRIGSLSDIPVPPETPTDAS